MAVLRHEFSTGNQERRQAESPPHCAWSPAATIAQALDSPWPAHRSPPQHFAQHPYRAAVRFARIQPRISVLTARMSNGWGHTIINLRGPCISLVSDNRITAREWTMGGSIGGHMSQICRHIEFSLLCCSRWPHSAPRRFPWSRHTRSGRYVLRPRWRAVWP